MSEASVPEEDDDRPVPGYFPEPPDGFRWVHNQQLLRWELLDADDRGSYVTDEGLEGVDPDARDAMLRSAITREAIRTRAYTCTVCGASFTVVDDGRFTLTGDAWCSPECEATAREAGPMSAAAEADEP